MSVKKEHIDELFKRSFDEAKLAPPSNAFSAIQNQINVSSNLTTATTTTKLSLKSWVLTTVVTVAVTTGVWWYANDNGKSVPQAVVDSTHQIIASDSLGKLSQAATVINDFRPELASQEKEKRVINSEINVISEVPNVAVVETVPQMPLPNTERKIPGIVTSEKGEDMNEKSTEKLLVPMHSNNRINSASVKDCSGRLKVDFEDDILGPWQMHVTSNSGFAKYQIGCESDKLNTYTGSKLDWKGNLNVKNNQWLNFWVTAHFEDGCRDTFRKSCLVKVDPQQTQWMIPTVFTPNKDGFNDSFYVQITKPMEFEMMISDHAGNVVFQAIDSRAKWDGSYQNSPVPSGSYRITLKTKYLGEKSPTVKTQMLLLKRN